MKKDIRLDNITIKFSDSNIPKALFLDAILESISCVINSESVLCSKVSNETVQGVTQKEMI